MNGRLRFPAAVTEISSPVFYMSCGVANAPQSTVRGSSKDRAMLRIGLEGPVVETASCPPAHGLMRAREPGHYDRKHPDKLRRGPRRRRTKPRVPGDPARLGPGTIGARDQRGGPSGAAAVG